MENNTDLPPFSVIIPAGGQGNRLGADRPKALVPIHDVPMIQHTIHSFQSLRTLQHVAVSLPGPPARYEQKIDTSLPCFSSVSFHFCSGGSTRFSSVRNAFQQLPKDGPEQLLIHDAARPLVSPSLIRSVLRETTSSGACFPAIPIHDAMHRTETHQLKENIPRNDKVRAQTPQGFQMPILKQVFQKWGDQDSIPFPDDASLVHNAGYEVTSVRGNPRNFKITYPEHLKMARALLPE